MVGIAAARCVDPADPRQFKHFPHAIEEVVLQFAQRAVGMGQALLRQQIVRRLGARAKGQRFGDVSHEVLEVGAAGHGGALALHFDHGTNTLGQVGVDSQAAGGSLTIGTHRLRLHTLLPQPIDGLVGVAATCLQGLLALHHRQARLVAEGHHGRCGDLSQGLSPL